MSTIFGSVTAWGQNDYAHHFTRPLHDVMSEVGQRFKVRFKYNVDTTGLKLPYADFRIRPYSLEETLQNICKYYDFNYWDQGNGVYKIKPYEYARRHDSDGQAMITWLRSLYSNASQFDARRDSVRREVRRLLQFDIYADSLVRKPRVILSAIRKYDGYSVRNICIETLPGEHVFGSIYAPLTKGKHALIICPNGHFNQGRYRKDQQQRMGTLARMGAVCVDYDLYGYGQSASVDGHKVHAVPRAHVVQALNGIVLLNYMLSSRKDIDTSRIGVNGGSGGGTQTVLLSVLDNRFTAIAPTVSLASHFDGGCPCESGMPIQLAGGGTCNAELAAFFAPKPMLIVSDGGDWTHTVPTLEYPYLQYVYGFYGAADKVENVHLPKEHHDFGINKRNAVYDFFIKTFHLNRAMLDESKVTIEPEEKMLSAQ